MKIIQPIHSYLAHVLSKESRIDWRFLVVCILVGYFSVLLIASFFTEYYNFWRLLGVPAQDIKFGDLRIVFSGFECTRLGYDVLLEDPCNPFNQPNHRAIFYPRIWWLLAPLGLGQKHTVPLGIVFTLLFYIVTLIKIGKSNYYEAIIYSLILCSPSVMLLIERDNPDIIIFLLLFISLTIISKSSSLIYKFIAYAIILFAALLKLYPIFGLCVILREKRKTCIVLIASLVTIFLIYIFSHLEEMKTISREVTNTTWYSYGYKVIFEQINSYLLSAQILASKKNIIKLVMGIIVGLVSCLVGYKIVVSVFQEFKAWLSHRFHPENNLSYLENTDHLDDFRLGSSLYIGTFLLGSVFVYKLTFLLLVIPLIFNFIKSRSKLSLSSSIALFGIIATLYLSPFDLFSLHEVINWFLLGYFVYSLSLTLPNWIKFSIHNTLSFNTKFK
ncbi:hypothetical protein [Nostoc sp.]|uniref:hypothetical protein n=1 Tax=Nostoc sp. TaxID=1180 RepID=UPI002FF56640